MPLALWVADRRYKDIAIELPAVLNVLLLFEDYQHIDHISQLTAKVEKIRERLTIQLTNDLKTAFKASNNPIKKINLSPKRLVWPNHPTNGRNVSCCGKNKIKNKTKYNFRVYWEANFKRILSNGTSANNWPFTMFSFPNQKMLRGWTE